MPRSQPQPELSLREFVEHVAAQHGVDLRGYKVSTLERRIHKRMQEIGTKGYRAYQKVLQDDPSEAVKLLNTVLINVTEFFRDPAAWEYLRTEVLPGKLERVKHGGSFRAWVAGCSTGEEAFSLAILLADHFGPRLREYDVKIYATDIDDHALNVGRHAEEPAERLRGGGGGGGGGGRQEAGAG